MTHPLSGVYAPVVTPFGRDLAPDTVRLARLCRTLLDDGCHGLVLFGTTGEANSLALAERQAVLDAVVGAGIPADRLIVGTGLCAIPETVALTRHALDHGCRAVLMLPPFYYKAISDEGLYAAYAETFERVGAAGLSVVLYHIPQVSGVGLSHGLIEHLRAAWPETVVGIKDSTGDWDHTRSLIERFPGLATFCGTETLLLATLGAGGVGTIAAGANVNARALRALFDGWRGDDAKARQAAITAVRQALQTAPMIPGLKAVVAQRFADPAYARVRPPFLPLGEARGLLAALAGAGYREVAPIAG